MKYRDLLYQNYSNNFGAAKPAKSSGQFSVFERTYRELSEIPKSGKVGDLGCGRGEWLIWLAEQQFEDLVGVDVAGSELKKAFEGRDSLRLVESEVTKHLEEKSDHYNLLHAKDVFEHLTKDEAVAFLQAARGALKEGGELWILTYNAQAPIAEATGAGDFTHELAVTPSSMAQVARATGFEVASIRGFVPARIGWKGSVRLWLYDLVTFPTQIVKRLRHGQGQSGASEQVELHSLRPDLFIRLRKGPERS